MPDFDLGATGFVRIVTNPKIWQQPTSTEDALLFVERLRVRRNARPLTHGPTSFALFADLCRAARARGKLVADAYQAALAIEHGCELVTADGDSPASPDSDGATRWPGRQRNTEQEGRQRSRPHRDRW